MRFQDEQLDSFLQLRRPVIIPDDLESKIMNFVAAKARKSQSETSIWSFIQDAFSSLFVMKYTYALSGFLLIGITLGFVDSAFFENDYLSYAELFYHEESLL